MRSRHILLLAVALGGMAVPGTACTKSAPPEPTPVASLDAGTVDPKTDPERYRGKPLLIVLENYALDTINELPAEQQEQVREIVKHMYGGGDDWRATVRQAQHWPPTIDHDILTQWRLYSREGVESAHPEQYGRMQFAMAFADSHFHP